LDQSLYVAICLPQQGDTCEPYSVTPRFCKVQGSDSSCNNFLSSVDVGMESSGNTDEITLTTYIHLKDLSIISNLIPVWPGPISVSLHGPMIPFNEIANKINSLKIQHKGGIDFHLVTTGQKNIELSEPLLQNIAIAFSRTDSILSIDSGFIPTLKTYSLLRSSPYRSVLDHLPDRHAFIIPVLRSSSSSKSTSTSKSISFNVVNDHNYKNDNKVSLFYTPECPPPSPLHLNSLEKLGGVLKEPLKSPIGCYIEYEIGQRGPILISRSSPGFSLFDESMNQHTMHAARALIIYGKGYQYMRLQDVGLIAPDHIEIENEKIVQSILNRMTAYGNNVASILPCMGIYSNLDCSSVSPPPPRFPIPNLE